MLPVVYFFPLLEFIGQYGRKDEQGGPIFLGVVKRESGVGRNRRTTEETVFRKINAQSTVDSTNNETHLHSRIRERAGKRTYYYQIHTVPRTFQQKGRAVIFPCSDHENTVYDLERQRDPTRKVVRIEAEGNLFGEN